MLNMTLNITYEKEQKPIDIVWKQNELEQIGKERNGPKRKAPYI